MFFSIFVPLVGLVFPAIVTTYLFMRVQKKIIAYSSDSL